MGDRVTVSISGKDHETPINIYSRWSGNSIYQVVADTLASSQRIGDGSYLTAQIIQAVFKEYGYDGKLSFGVWSGEVSSDNWDDNPTMYVDTDNGSWRIGDGEMDWQDKDTPLEDVWSCECADCATCPECGGVKVVSYEDKDGEALGEPCPNCKEN